MLFFCFFILENFAIVVVMVIIFFEDIFCGEESWSVRAMLERRIEGETRVGRFVNSTERCFKGLNTMIDNDYL